LKHHFQQQWPINQLFILLSTILVTLVIFRYAAALLVPFLIALAIAIVLSPLFRYLEARHIPRPISLILVAAFPLALLIFLGAYVSEEISELVANAQSMKAQFDASMAGISQRMAKIGISFTPEQISNILTHINVSSLIQRLAAHAGNQFSNLFLIFFIAAFILMETDCFFAKLQKVMADWGQNMDEIMEFLARIKSYFLLKVKTSLITGLWVALVLWYLDISYAVLWATLAFFLNFIPVIGSILAAIPPILVASLEQSWVTAVWVTAWYLVINTVIGNILEPKIMGKGLGLSALVIFLSMTFWGWMFGPAGMILSAPLTMGMQFLFSRYEETLWIAFILSDCKPKADAKKASAASG